MENIFNRIMKFILDETEMPLLEEERSKWKKESEENLRVCILYEMAKAMKEI